MHPLSPLALAGCVVCMMLAAYLPAILRCTVCGVRFGQKHHDGCHYKEC